MSPSVGSRSWTIEIGASVYTKYSWQSSVWSHNLSLDFCHFRPESHFKCVCDCWSCMHHVTSSTFVEWLQYWYCKMAARAIATRYKWFSVIFLARKWRCIVWLLRRWNDVTGRGTRGQQGGRGMTVLEGMVGRSWVWELGKKKASWKLT